MLSAVTYKYDSGAEYQPGLPATELAAFLRSQR